MVDRPDTPERLGYDELTRYNPQLKVTQTLSAVFPYEFGLLEEYIDKLKSRLRIAVIHGGDKDNDGAVIFRTQPRLEELRGGRQHIAGALRGRVRAGLRDARRQHLPG
jgi:hypothetical protein